MLESAPEKCVFKNHVPSAASETKFNHANRIPCLKVGALVDTESRLSKCQGKLSITYLFDGRFAGPFVVAKQTVNQTALFCPQTHKMGREDNSDEPETFPELLAFFICAYLFEWWHLRFLSASMRNQANTPINTHNLFFRIKKQRTCPGCMPTSSHSSLLLLCHFMSKPLTKHSGVIYIIIIPHLHRPAWIWQASLDNVSSMKLWKAI